MLPYRELREQGFSLLVVEAKPGTYRLYVGQDGQRFCNYDTGQFESLDEAVTAARAGFSPEPFLLFPYAPYSRREVLERAPDAIEHLMRGGGPDPGGDFYRAKP